MNGIYLELARVADEDRARTLSADVAARRTAVLLRAAGDCCRRTLAMHLRAKMTAGRSRLGLLQARPACC